MKIIINKNSDVKHLTLSQALQFDAGTMFKVYDNSKNSSGFGFIGLENTTHKKFMIQLNESGNIFIFAEEPRYPFSFELMPKDFSATLVQK